MSGGRRTKDEAVVMMKSLVILSGGRQCLDVLLVFSPVELADRKNTNPCQLLAKVLLHAEQVTRIQQFADRSRHTATGTHVPYGLHSLTCHPAEVTFQPLPQPKLVLDLATPEGCKSELT